MSFILEGLKKSEQKRSEGDVPNLQTLHKSPSTPPRRKIWPLLLCCALILNAVILVWWLRPWQNEPECQPVVETEKQAAPAVAAIPAQQRPKIQPVLPPVPKPVPPPIPTAQPPAELIPEPPPEVVQEEAELANLARPAQLPRLVEDPPPPVEPVAEESVYPTLEDMPSSIRRELPPFNFSLHFFSEDPAQRMVRINGRILREGQELSSGLVLAEITNQGALFSYRGFDFEVSAF